MVSYERYKGNNIICLTRNETDRYPFSFGYGKAKLILQHLDEIRAFVAKEEENQAKEVPSNGN